MVNKCSVSNCTNTRKDAILYKFPSNQVRHEQWLSCLNLQPSQTRRFVCDKHFEKKYIGPGSRLISGAYPTLLKPNEISSGIPDDTENVDPHKHEQSYARKRKHVDHNYCQDLPSSSGSSYYRPVLAVIHEEQEKNIDSGKISTVAPPQAEKDFCTSTIHPSGYTEKSSVFVVKRSTGTATRSDNATVPSGKTASRKRLIDKFQKLSPTAKKIYAEYKKAKNQLNFLSRAKRALKFSKDKSFEKLSQDMNPYAKKFIAMQMKLCKKKKQGRRFSLDEKLIALAIMKQSPRCYRFLHRIFILPSPTTLNKLVSKLDIEAGINPKLFELMTKQVSTWKPEKKYCSIVFDEMALGMGVTYNNKKDEISGFVDLNKRKNRFADHVLVFMLRGAIHKWQQPVAYHFCEGATSGPELKNIIKDIVEAVTQTGLKPLVLGCDQGTAFQSAIKSLQADTRRSMLEKNEEPDDSILIGETKLNVIYDPSHLIKGIRNNFLTKNITSNGKVSKWQDIVDVYQTDCNHTETRLLHKLNDEHVIPEKIKKMKVKNCVRVLSKTMAAALLYTAQFSHYIDGRPVSSTIRNTAETVSFFDDLFDSINGSSVNHKNIKGKLLRSAVHEKSKHHEFWPQAIKKLEDMRFVDANGKEKCVPTLKKFVTTLKSYMKLWQFFKTLNIKVMRPRYYNTDPIENYFGQVRAYNYRNNNPTCHNFTSTFKALTITRVLNFHSESYNCEDDPAKPIIDLKSLFVETEKSQNTTQRNRESDMGRSGHLEMSINPIDTTNVLEQARRERLNTHSKAYVTGWVVNKYLQKNPSCNICKQNLTSTSSDTTHQWISMREFKTCKKSKKLCYPSEKAVRFFGTIQKETNEYLEKNAHEKEIKKNILESIHSKYSFDLVDCPEHESSCLMYLLDICIRFGIYNWCNIINKILKGVDVARLKGKTLPYYQSLALRKFQKTLKKSNKTT